MKSKTKEHDSGKSKRTRWVLVITIIALVALLLANIWWGAIHIPADEIWNICTGKGSSNEAWHFIVLESRIPQAITAVLCGASLAVSGLMLQTVFNNPLAGPSILGINGGASLGVATVMLFMGGSFTVAEYTLSSFLSVAIGAFAGAMIVLAIILFFSTLVKSNLMLLIIGIMVGYMTSSIISLLNFFSTAEGVHSYMAWGMGNFSGVTRGQLPLFISIISIGLIVSILLIKPLNALLLGQHYASNLGINIRLVRNLLLVGVGLLIAITTAFCGPISFIGLAVPHMARLTLKSSNHNVLLPYTLIFGGVVALLCNLISVIPGEYGLIPLNAVTPMISAPVIIYVIVNQRKIQYFN